MKNALYNGIFLKEAPGLLGKPAVQRFSFISTVLILLFWRLLRWSVSNLVETIQHEAEISIPGQYRDRVTGLVETIWV